MIDDKAGRSGDKDMHLILRKREIVVFVQRQLQKTINFFLSIFNMERLL